MDTMQMKNKTYAIQTKTPEQALAISKDLDGVLFSDEDDTMFEADITPDEYVALEKDPNVIYLSPL